jgi:hypothetical protein
MYYCSGEPTGIVIDEKCDITHPSFIDDLLRVRRMLPFVEGVENEFMNWMATDERPSGLDKALHSWLLAFKQPYPNIEKRIAEMEEFEQRQDISKTGKKPKTSGYIYLIRSDNKGFKIGYTTNPKNRITTLEVKLPFAIEYECLIKTDDIAALEKDLHTQFADKRINGEWFDLSEDDVKYIKSLAE